jgi:BlaI family penicillinase repressor
LKTIHTLIRRLVKKQVIAAQPGVAPYSYYPLVTENAYIREKTRSFIDRVYDGSFSLMVARFVKDEKLSSKEIEELKKILDQK